jgi:dTDP-4-dehydrorhamnose 3,5-epimerase
MTVSFSKVELPKRNDIMEFEILEIPGAWIIDMMPHCDERGRFMRAWCSREFAEHGIEFIPVQVNMGFSVHKGTIRGMHYQKEPALEAKLMRCTRGSIYDVLVDLRPGSPSFGKWFGAELSAESGRMLFVPENCAHGYQTLEDNTEILYMTSGYYAPRLASGVRFDDPAFNIHWPLIPSAISDQDRNWPLYHPRESGIL